jgi:type II secretory pathway predicted ATPase ExeA
MREPTQLPPFPLGMQATAAELGLTGPELARAAGLSKSTVHRLMGHGVWPTRRNRGQLQERLQQLFKTAGATPEQLNNLFQPVVLFEAPGKGKAAKARAKAASHPPSHHHSNQENDPMVIPKQPLTQDARKAFGLFINPFDGEVETADQMFQNTEFRYCREACWQAAAHGRFVAVIGESGAGKTTLLGDLQERIDQERKQIVVIRPSVLGMEDSDKTGKTLKATGIMDAAIYSLDETARPRQTMEAKTRQLQAMLEASAKAGNVHLILIEEAHGLPVNTLRHLKRLHEMRMGRKPLLGILLIGQPELKKKLNPKRHDLREVVQRCEVVELQPLDADLQGYLKVRLARVAKSLDELMDQDAVDAVRHRLTVQAQSRPGDRSAPVVSQVYPLAVNNFMTMVLNSAAELGVPRVTRDVVLAA